MKLTSSSPGFEVEVVSVTHRKNDAPAPRAGNSMGDISAEEIRTLKLDTSRQRTAKHAAKPDAGSRPEC